MIPLALRIIAHRTDERTLASNVNVTRFFIEPYPDIQIHGFHRHPLDKGRQYQHPTRNRNGFREGDCDEVPVGECYRRR